MADFTITVTGPQATRVSKAFGHAVLGQDMQQTWQNATAAEVIAALKQYMKDRVIGYEASQASQTVQQTGSTETW